jgi:hypothetical protein
MELVATASRNKILSTQEKGFLQDTTSSPRKKKSTCTIFAALSMKWRFLQRQMDNESLKTKAQCLVTSKFKTKLYMRTRMKRNKTETWSILMSAPIAKDQRTRTRTKILLANSTILNKIKL